MKAFANNKVYVQKKDLTHLLKAFNGKSIPSSIIDRVFRNVFLVDNSNKYEFVEFESPKEVEFFRNCTWIVDYNDFDDKTYEEIMKDAFNIFEEYNRVTSEYNELPEEEKIKEDENISIALELLEYKMWSIRDVLWHKQGHLKITLPEGVRVNYIDGYIPEEPKKQSVLRRLLNRFK